MRYLVTSLLITLITLTTSLHAMDDLRTWSDTTGKFQIEAKFISLDGTKVLLEKADGTRIQIDLIKLSNKDRAEAIKLHANRDDNPFKEKEKENNPFKDAAKGSTARDRMNSRNTVNAGNLSKVDWSGARLLSVFGSDWKPPTLPSTDLKLNWQPRPVSLPSRDFFEKVTGVLASAVSKQAVVVTALEKPGTTSTVPGSIYLCDLVRGVILKEFPIVVKQTPLAINADGTQLVTREDVWGHNKSRILNLWNISPSELKLVHRWDGAKDDKAMHGVDINGAAFLSDNTLLLWQSSGMLTWWNTTDLKPTQMLQLQANSTPSFTSNMQVIAARANNDLVLLDAATGETLSIKPLGHVPFNRMAFSPDGKKLACVSHSKTEIFDLATGDLTSEMSTTGFSHETPCFWASPTALLAGFPLCFISTELNINIWGYDGIERLTMLGDTAIILVKGQGFTLVPVKLPHSGALQLIEQAKKDPNFFVLKPGTTVRIDASGISDAALQQEAVDALTKSLQKAGHSVGSGDVTLKVSMERSKDHELSYHTFGTPSFGRPNKTHSVPGWTYQLKLAADGRTHWTMSGGNHPPPFIHLKENETIESHLKQYGVANVNFFKHVEMPKYVARAQTDQNTGSQSLRRSQVTSSGIR